MYITPQAIVRRCCPLLRAALVALHREVAPVSPIFLPVLPDFPQTGEARLSDATVQPPRRIRYRRLLRAIGDQDHTCDALDMHCVVPLHVKSTDMHSRVASGWALTSFYCSHCSCCMRRQKGSAAHGRKCATYPTLVQNTATECGHHNSSLSGFVDDFFLTPCCRPAPNQIVKPSRLELTCGLLGMCDSFEGGKQGHAASLQLEYAHCWNSAP
ncbi:hypothetical protein B0T17DRAFT_182777 [Bombardia bombarda]|uniref:Uncharacterized protein n=1 Tax=Bombardia bombarda TaxID=252184 RepID=A0AA39X9P1_9PEZI|nr:hypothetical protein B0T17DRAFT_182777 [Bombardia bombarda]